jgi:hypothetical protein
MDAVHLLNIQKIETKHKINDDKNNFLYFQYIECTNFKTEIFLFIFLTSVLDVLFSIF